MHTTALACARAPSLMLQGLADMSILVKSLRHCEYQYAECPNVEFMQAYHGNIDIGCCTSVQVCLS